MGISLCTTCAFKKVIKTSTVRLLCLYLNKSDFPLGLRLIKTLGRIGGSTCLSLCSCFKTELN